MNVSVLIALVQSLIMFVLAGAALFGSGGRLSLLVPAVVVNIVFSCVLCCRQKLTDRSQATMRYREKIGVLSCFGVIILTVVWGVTWVGRSVSPLFLIYSLWLWPCFCLWCIQLRTSDLCSPTNAAERASGSKRNVMACVQNVG